MLSQEYQELRQQISNSDRTMSQNIRGIYLHKKFIFLPFNFPIQQVAVCGNYENLSNDDKGEDQ
jgi:hypothetical protein